MRVRRTVPEQKISLLPLTEAEKSALQFAVVLVLNSIETMDNKDIIATLAIKSQLEPLKNIKQKLVT